jgi:hypothetical protein
VNRRFEQTRDEASDISERLEEAREKRRQLQRVNRTPNLGLRKESSRFRGAVQ